MFSDYLTRVKSAINDVAKAKTEQEIYRCLAEALINHLGFNRATIRKANWEKNSLSLVCYVGFMEEIPSFKLPLSEESGALGKAALKGEGIVVFEDGEIPSERLPSEFAGLQSTSSHSFAVIPIKVKGQVRIVFEVDRKTSGGGITPQDKEILELFSEMVETVLEKVFAQEELKRTLIRDELTGLFNRRYFTNRLREEYERAKRYGVPLSLCIFDIDNFKLINDTYGHIFGDQVLRQIGKLTAEVVRHVDIAARYGGEEFTVLFTHTTLENAVTIAERIHRAISTLTFPHNEKEIRVTATFGISTYSPASVREPGDLLHHADMALYEGKKRYDKNCVVICTGSDYKILKRFEPFPQTQWAETKGGTADKKEPTSLQIILSTVSKNLRNCHQMANGLIQNLRMPIRKLERTPYQIETGTWKALPLLLSKRSSFALLSLAIVLPVIILFASIYEKGRKSIFPSSSISTPDNGFNQLRLNLIETLSLGDKISEKTLETTPFVYLESKEAKRGQVSLKKENRVSLNRRIQHRIIKPRTKDRKELLAKHRIHSQPRSLAALLKSAKEKKERRISSQFILAFEKKKELLAQQLRKAFLLAYY